MGVDFRIDDSPRYRLTGVVGEPTVGHEWKGAKYDGDLLDGTELRSVIESHSYEGPIDLRIETVRQEPPLPADALAVDHESPAWAYSGFGRFRQRLASTIGVDLDMMEGYGSETTVLRRYARDALGIPGGEWYGAAGKDFEAFKAKATAWWEETARYWSEVDSDLVPLLHHSDCDGDLSPEDCARVAPALRQALEQFDAAPAGSPASHDREKGLRLAQMMEACAKFNRRLVFC